MTNPGDAPPSPGAARRHPTGTRPPTPDAAERHRMIAIAAYYLAEQRGFAPGRELDDWHRAAAQIDTLLANGELAGGDSPDALHNRLRHALRLRDARREP